jgi:RHS repeat-associated protein
MQMPGRKYNSGNGYRYGFNGKEMDNSTGEGNLDFGARIYDNRLGRWLGVDKYIDKYPNVSPYAFCINSPLQFKDINGNWLVDKFGNIIYTIGPEAHYHIVGNEVYRAQIYYFYTNDGQAVEAINYDKKTLEDNCYWNGSKNNPQYCGLIDGDKTEAIPDLGDCTTISCHGNSLNFMPGYKNFYVGGLDESKCDNVEKVYKNKAEFTPIKAEDVKPGDIAIFELGGKIQHSATVTNVSENGNNVKLTSKDDRNPVKQNQTIEDITKSNPLYKNFAGYYRKNTDKKVDVEVKGNGFPGFAGDVSEQQIKVILEEAKK